MLKFIKNNIGKFLLLVGVGFVLTQDFSQPPFLIGVECIDNPTKGLNERIETCPITNGKEKAQFKSKEIAKLNLAGEYTRNGFTIEIIGEVKEINIDGQSGIEFFAKSWKGTKQLGFSKDGSVEIERFRIFNPPILVDDPNGTIVREWTQGGETKQRKLREDPAEAIRQDLAHTISIVSKENTAITKGKVGNTTSTFYSSATGDGQVAGSAASWAGIRDATTGTADTTDAIETFPQGSEFAGTFYVGRNFYPTDTSALPDTDTVDSATFSIFFSGAGSNEDTTTLEVVQTSQASMSALASGDFDNLTFTSGGSVAYDTTAAYKDITINATGLTWISKTDFTKIGAITGVDLSNTTPTGLNQSNGYYSDQAGTTNDPKLVVVHSAAVVASPDVQDIIIIDEI